MSGSRPNQYEDKELTFINRAPEDKEWTARIKLLNEWVTPDRYLRDILIYNRSGKHYPTDMHVDLIQQLITQKQLEARKEENRFHWHRQRAITKQAGNGTISMYFLDRIEELTTQEGK
jgi:hypothetical protein